MDVNAQSALPLGPTSYRAGYRYVESGEVICTVEIAASIAESAVLRHSKLGMLTTADGYIESSLNMIAVTASTDEWPFLAEPIDALVVRLLGNENLQMEEATAAKLATLLQRLERSVGLVKDAIDRMVDAKGSSATYTTEISGSPVQANP